MQRHEVIRNKSQTLLGSDTIMLTIETITDGSHRGKKSIVNGALAKTP